MSARRCGIGVNRSIRTTVFVTTLSVLLGAVGCRKSDSGRRTQPARVAYTVITNPVRELCTDDSESRSEFFSVNLVRFEGRKIRLDGTEVTSEYLRQWTLRKYENLPEQVLRVQFQDRDEQFANQALLPIVTALPQLHVRRAPFAFSCPKL